MTSFDAHRVIWLAGERGVQDGVAEALFEAYFTDGRDLSGRGMLAAAAAEGGLGPADVDEMLAGDRGSAEVREWLRKGQGLGITGVPFFVFNGSLALAGAQAPETFRAAIEKATVGGEGEAWEVDAAGEGKC